MRNLIYAALGIAIGTSTAQAATPLDQSQAKGAPIMRIASPEASGSMPYAAPAHFVVRAECVATDASICRAIAQVDFYSGSTRIATQVGPARVPSPGITPVIPWMATYSNVAAGRRVLRIVTRHQKSDGSWIIARGQNEVTVDVATWAGRVLYVSTTGNDRNIGSSHSPLRTIQRAADLAQPGDRIYIRPGIYAAGFKLPRSGTRSRPILFSKDPDPRWADDSVKANQVIIDGSRPLAGWKPEGNHVYSTAWTQSYSVFENGAQRRYRIAPCPIGCAEQFHFKKIGRNTGFLRQLNTSTTDADGKSVYGRLPWQAGSFWVDWNNQRVHVRLPDDLDPRAGGTVYGAVETRFIKSTGVEREYIWLRGLRFQHAANFAQFGAITMGRGWRLEGCLVQHTSGVGIYASGAEVAIINSVSQDNGQLGIGGSRLQDVLLSGISVHRNNTRGHNANNEAGGAKFTRSHGVLVERMTATGNAGPGLWFDIYNGEVVVRDGLFSSSTGQPYKGTGGIIQGIGVEIEVSLGPALVERNRFSRNQNAGLGLAESSLITVRSNTFTRAANETSGANMLHLRSMVRTDWSKPGLDEDDPNAEMRLEDVSIFSNRFEGGAKINTPPPAARDIWIFNNEGL